MDYLTNWQETHRIEQHWDDMLRIAGSLKLGTVQVSELIRSLLKSERPSGLAQSIIEVGRINKTLYLLNYTASGHKLSFYILIFALIC